MNKKRKECDGCPKDLEEEELHTLDGDSAEDRCLGDVGI